MMISTSRGADQLRAPALVELLDRSPHLRCPGPAGDSAVGTPDLQVLNDTARQVHGADISVIRTNGRVTALTRGTAAFANVATEGEVDASAEVEEDGISSEATEEHPVSEDRTQET